MYEDFFELLGVSAKAPDWQLDHEIKVAAGNVLKVYGENPPGLFPFALGMLSDPRGRSLYRELLKLSDKGGGKVAPDRMGQLAAAAEAVAPHFMFEQLNATSCRVSKFAFDIPSTETDPPASKTSRSDPPRQKKSRPQPSKSNSNSSLTRESKYGMINGEPPPLVLGDRVFSWCCRYSHLRHVVNMGNSYHLTWQNRETGAEWSSRDYMAPFYPGAFHAGCYYGHIHLTDTATRELTTEAVFATDHPACEFRYSMCWGGLMSYFPWSKHPGTESPIYKRRRAISPPFFGAAGRTRNGMNDIMHEYAANTLLWTYIYAWAGQDVAPELFSRTVKEDTARLLYYRFGWKPSFIKKRYGLRLPAK